MKRACRFCGYKWKPKIPQPKECPRCKGRLDYKPHPKPVKEHVPVKSHPKPVREHISAKPQKYLPWPKYIAKRFAPSESSKAPIKQVWVALVIAALMFPALIFIMASRSEPVAADPGTFGYDTQGGSWQICEDNIVGSWFTAPETGTVTSITAYVDDPDGPAPYKFAVYRKSNGSCVCKTDGGFAPMGGGWLTINTTTGGSISEGDNYWLLAWGGDVKNQIAYDTEAGKGGYMSQAYGEWPGQFEPTLDDKKYSIYATYILPYPGQPELYYPDNDLMVYDNTPTFKWTVGENSDNNRIIVDDDSDCQSPIDNVTLGKTDNIWTKTGDGYSVNSYYWQVININALGENASAIWTFSISSAKPTQPLLFSPSDGATENDNTPTFEWIKAENTENHNIKVDNDSDFSSPEIDITVGSDENTYTPTTALSDENYSWKVIAKNANGENESQTWTFQMRTTYVVTNTVTNLTENSATLNATITFGGVGSVNIRFAYKGENQALTESENENWSIIYYDSPESPDNIGNWANRTPVKYIAASDSSAEDKAAADNIVSGTNDGWVISKVAENLANYGGGTIFLFDGHYMGAFVIFVDDNVSIIGESRENTIIQIINTPQLHLGMNINSEGNENVLIENLRFEGLGREAPGEQIGVFLRKGRNSVIRNCYLDEYAAIAIYADENADKIWVINCEIRETGDAGIVFADSSHMRVLGNTVISAGMSSPSYPSGGDGISLAQPTCSHNIIANNVVENTGRYGIVIWKQATGENNLVQGNVVKHSSKLKRGVYPAIYTGLPYTIIRGNDIDGFYGLQIVNTFNCSMENNSFYNTVISYLSITESDHIFENNVSPRFAENNYTSWENVSNPSYSKAVENLECPNVYGFRAEIKYGTQENAGAFLVFYTVNLGQPMLYLPENNSDDENSKPYFEWTNGSQSEWNKLVVAKNENFADNVLSMLFYVPDNSYTPITPLSPQQYWWKVIAGYGTYENSSDIWTFQVVLPPTKPILYLPVNATTSTDNAPYFEWKLGSYATNHRLLVDSSPPDWIDVVENRLFAGDENSYQVALENSYPFDNYSWKVIAINILGENNSDVWTFELREKQWQLIETWMGTTKARSAPPIPYLPANNSTISDNTPYFEWIKAIGIENHRLIVDNDSDFSSPEENQIVIKNWNILTIDDNTSSDLRAVGWPAMVIDNSGAEHIAYYDYDNRNLMYAKRIENEWDIEVIDNEGWGASISLDNEGKPRIAYQYYSADYINCHLRYAEWDGSQWQREIVDNSVIYTGEHPSIAVDENNKAHISYRDGWNDALMYAKQLDDGNWSIEAVDNAGGGSPYLTLDSNDCPHISYEIYSTSQLKYAKKLDSGEWQIENVDNGNIEYTSIVCDENNNPHILYFDVSEGVSPVHPIRYARYTGSEWQIENVIDGKVSDSIAISNGSIYISFYAEDYLASGNRNGEWKFENIHKYGSPSSIVIDADGFPRYLFNASSDLKLAKCGDNFYTIAPENSLPDGSYFWKVMAISDDGEIPSATWAFTISTCINVGPNPPTDLLFNEQKNPTKVPYEWVNSGFSATVTDNNDGDTITHYRIQVDNDSDFSSLFADTSKQLLDWSIQEGENGRIYNYYPPWENIPTRGITWYWRIKFWDSKGAEGEWSTEVATFKQNQLPTPPTNWTDLGMRLIDHTPTISWTKGTDADGDNITTYIYVNEIPTPIFLEGSTSGNAIDLGQNMVLWDGVSYYYRLRSYDGEEFSSFTIADGFMMNTPPLIVSSPLISPQYPIDADDLTCFIEHYEDVNGDPVTLYYQWFENDEIIAGQTASVLNSDQTKVESRYKYNATPFDGYEYGLTKSSNEVTVKAVNIPPITSNPKCGGKTDPVDIPTKNPTFSWTFYDADGDTQSHWQIYVGTENGSSDKWNSGTCSGSYAQAIYAGSTLDNNKTYYWRVRTRDGRDWSAWVTGCFTTNFPSIPPTVIPENEGSYYFIPADEDASVFESNPDAQFGFDTRLYCGMDTGFEYTYLKFDLSSLENYDYISIDLSLVADGCKNVPIVEVWRGTNDWSEPNITWNTRPQVIEQVTTMGWDDGEDLGLYRTYYADVTNIVDRLFKDGIMEVTFVLKPTGSPVGRKAIFMSREAGTFHTLEILYTPSTPLLPAIVVAFIFTIALLGIFTWLYVKIRDVHDVRTGAWAIACVFITLLAIIITWGVTSVFLTT